MKYQITAAIAALIITITSPNASAEAPLKSAAAQKEAKSYPLETCIVSDDKLGEMGKPVVFIHNGQEIKVCCKECRTDFDKKPKKFLKKLPKP